MIAHFNLYGSIGEYDPMFKIWTGEDDPIISSQKVVDFLAGLDSSVTQINVHINSRGGDVDEGFTIHDLFKNSGKKIKTIVEGHCDSIATVPLMAGSEREGWENATGLIHNPWILLFDGYTADELAEVSERVKREEERLLDFYVKETGGDRETLAAFMKAETKFSAEEMLELKFLTKIAEPVKTFAFSKNQIHNEMSVKSKLTEALEKAKSFLNDKVVSAKTKDGIEFSAHTKTGKIEAGSILKDKEGKLMASANLIMADNTEIATDENGSVTEKAIETSKEVELTPEQMKAEMARLKSENDTLKAEKEAQANTAAETINALTTRLGEVKSTYTPKVSDTNFSSSGSPARTTGSKTSAEITKDIRDREEAAKKNKK